jgi:hypothetical protein
MFGIWTLSTEALLAKLNSERDLLRDYAATDKKQFIEREGVDGLVPPASNPYAVEQIAWLSMSSRPR